jgi:hypothetical protein
MAQSTQSAFNYTWTLIPPRIYKLLHHWKMKKIEAKHDSVSYMQQHNYKRSSECYTPSRNFSCPWHENLTSLYTVANEAKRLYLSGLHTELSMQGHVHNWKTTIPLVWKSYVTTFRCSNLMPRFFDVLSHTISGNYRAQDWKLTSQELQLRSGTKVSIYQPITAL